MTLQPGLEPGVIDEREGVDRQDDPQPAKKLASKSLRSSQRHPMLSMYRIMIPPWFTASGLILNTRLTTILRQRAMSLVARLRLV